MCSLGKDANVGFTQPNPYELSDHLCIKSQSLLLEQRRPFIQSVNPIPAFAPTARTAVQLVGQITNQRCVGKASILCLVAFVGCNRTILVTRVVQTEVEGGILKKLLKTVRMGIAYLNGLISLQNSHAPRKISSVNSRALVVSFF